MLPSANPPPLPTLTQSPAAHPDSCLSLSLPLLIYISSHLPGPHLAKQRAILSIGSGTGLLETLLSARDSSLTIHGVEPHPGTANKYLASEQLILVPGTWALLSAEELLQYSVIMSIYPREVELVGRYLELLIAAGVNAHGIKIVWAGPGSDFDDFGRVFERDGVEKMDVRTGRQAGVAEWEVVAVYHIHGEQASKSITDEV